MGGEELGIFFHVLMILNELFDYLTAVLRQFCKTNKKMKEFESTKQRRTQETLRKQHY